MDSFADLMASERQRINGERAVLRDQMHVVGQALQELDREMDAINAYEKAKTGKVSAAHTNGATRARRGSRREDIYRVVAANPGGVKRRELIEALGLKDDKSGEMAVSNALTALIKNDTLTRIDGKYVLSV